MAYTKLAKEIENTVFELDYEFKKVLDKYMEDMYEQYKKLHETGNAHTTEIYDRVCRNLIKYANRSNIRTQYTHYDGTVLEW